MRDPRKNFEYFTQTIASKEKGITLFQSRFDEAFDDEERDEISERLIWYHLDLIKALYSSNGSLDDIKNHLSQIFELLEYCEFEDEYVESLWILSISYVLDVASQEIEILKKRILENKYDDFVISSILNALFPDVVINDHINWKKPYQKLQGILELKQNADVHLLKQYLENHWYSGSSHKAWYECHKKDINAYTGYWAFETVALVKLFNLDDSILQGIDYYPGELLSPP